MIYKFPMIKYDKVNTNKTQGLNETKNEGNGGEETNGDL